MASVTAGLPTRLRAVRPGPLALVAGTVVLLLLVRLLPDEGAGLAFRLAAAAGALLLLPGALVLRAFAWPREPALALTASFCLSLAIGFVAFMATFAVDGSLDLTIALIALAGVSALVPVATSRPLPFERSDRRVVAGVLLAGAGLAGLVWWTAVELGTGDVLFHLARARKIAEADTLSSVSVANEFRDGGLHSGYAFPLWHGFLAAIARLAGVDVTLVALHLSAILAPIAFLASYAAGAALFRSRAGGVAVLAAQVAQLAFSRGGGTGSFASLALPSSLTRVILFPALLALAFAYLRDRERRLLIPLGAAGLALAVIHPTYLIFAAIVLAGFAGVWLVLTSERRHALFAAAEAAAAVLVPAGLFFLWLLPVVTSTASQGPSEGELARAIEHYGGQLHVVGDSYRAAPEAITRAGPVVVAALAALPLLGFVLPVRRAWAALAVGSSFLVLALLLVPDLFSRFSDLVSISQSRRLAQFLPVPFVLAGAALLFGRFRFVGVLAGFAAGLVLALLYEAEITHEVERGGPVWPLWVAIIGTPLAVAVGLLFFWRRRSPDLTPTRWTAFAALAFVLPIAVAGLAGLDRRDTPDRDALTPGLVDELRGLHQDDVVFAPVGTSYRVAAFAPVFVAASPPPHVADTEENDPYRRARDVIRFFERQATGDAERRRLVERYGADWLLVDRTKPYPSSFLEGLEPSYEDDRYALYRIDAT